MHARGTKGEHFVTFNLASGWEAIADELGDGPALICDDTVRSWAEFDDRAARIAGALRSAGVGASSNVGLCLFNGNEYSEAQYGVFKERATPFNVNYRYTPTELASLFEDSDCEALFFSASVVDRLDEISEQLGSMKLVVQVGGDTVPDWALDFEALIADTQPASRIERSPDDIWMLYTGGTTGKPKGVMWPHGAMIGTMKPNYAGMKMSVPDSPAEAVAHALAIRDKGFTSRQLACAPLMHGTSGIAALSTLMQGGTVLTMGSESLDADVLWRMVEQHRATHITIVGDAFGRPMVEALDAAAERGKPYDLSSVFLVLSSGVMWSAASKEGLLRHGDMKLLDSLGSSEGTGFASKITGKGQKITTARFELGPNTQVFNEAGEPVQPGSGERGILAVGGHLPIGYYGDPEKSAETWQTIAGQRWSVPGDWATVEDDGTIILLGRGSVCINTGGEKVYPEEVEEALKLHPEVLDTNVVGVPDERWGQAITAVVEMVPGATVSDDDLRASVKQHLAGYKAPKSVVRVDKVARRANGKSDYKWAKSAAYAALGIDEDQ